MSYTTIKKVNSEGDVEDIKQFTNAFGGQAFVWSELFDKYIKDPTIPYDNWMIGEGKRLWDAWGNKNIPEWIRLVHGSTFDYAIVEYEKLSEIAGYYRKFSDLFGNSEKVCHLNEWADICDSLFKNETIKTCKGICFYGTSVSDDLWEIYNDENEECTPYNINKGNKHWFVFKEFNNISPD